MSGVVRAADVAPAERPEYWRHAVGNLLGPMEIGVGGGDAQDRLRLGEAGAVRVAELRAGRPGHAERTRRHIRRSDPEMWKVDVLVNGRAVIEQDGRQAMLGPGDFALVDLSRPARWRMTPMRLVTLVFPRMLLPGGALRVTDLTAVAFGGARGSAALLSGLARQLAGHLDDWAPAEGPQVGGAVLDLLSVALATRSGSDLSVLAGSRQRVLLARVRAFIEQRLSDPALSPDHVAAAHHISLRYLYRLFEAEGGSVAGWIRQRRLEQCRRDLLNPALADRSVSAIAAHWGLTNASHFSRTFRAAYGLPPTEYRALGGGSGAP
jgi:AraC-like DNA-binding protein